MVRWFGRRKENRDYILRRVGIYGKGKMFSHQEMIKDNEEDLKVNDYGLSCSVDISCQDRCRKFLNPNHKKTMRVFENEGYL
jgi:hypothetical protein